MSRGPSWFDRATQIIARIHEEKLPQDADLRARKRALSEGRPPFFRDTSWGRKCWEKAARIYLDQYRQRPAEELPLFGGLSPLERKRKKTVEHDAMLRLSGVSPHRWEAKR